MRLPVEMGCRYWMCAAFNAHSQPCPQPLCQGRLEHLTIVEARGFRGIFEPGGQGDIGAHSTVIHFAPDQIGVNIHSAEDAILRHISIGRLRRGGYCFPVCFHTPQVQTQGFFGHFEGFIKAVPGGDTAGKVRKIDTEAILRRFEDCQIG